MKKLVAGMVSVLVLASVSQADFRSDINAAVVLYNAWDIVPAEAAFRKMLKKYPAATVEERALVQRLIGQTLAIGTDQDAAFLELGKVATDYPTASPLMLANARYSQAGCKEKGGDIGAARAIWQAMIDDVTTPGDYRSMSCARLAYSHIRVGEWNAAVVAGKGLLASVPSSSDKSYARVNTYVARGLEGQGKNAEAQAYWVAAAVDSGWISTKHQVYCYESIDWVLLSKADAIVYLEKVRLMPRDVDESNKGFLGRVVSKLGSLE